MKNSSQTVWSRTSGWAAAVVALAATFVVAPSIARAVCVGDCNNDNEVTVSELITMVNIALGNAQITACTAGNANGDGEISISEIVAGVNSALNGCPPPTTGTCGDGITNGAEQCDPGSVCIGGTNASTTCTKEADCQGEGVCDTFGQQGSPGTVPRKVCSSDSECGGAKCIHCKRFGGGGCAVNCTTETADVINLVPGELDLPNKIVSGTSGAVVHADFATIPLVLTGTNGLIRGDERNGLIPTAQKANSIQLPRIPVQSIACACVRGSEFKTCGGTQYEVDGKTQSLQCTDLCDESGCTSRASVCEGKKPCTSVAGPGNSGEGVIGCLSLPLVNYSIVQDAGGSKCPKPEDLNKKVCVDEALRLFGGVTKNCDVNQDCPGGSTCGCVDATLPVFTPGAVPGGPGSQILASASAIGVTTGVCQGADPKFYGLDQEFCTDDDPPPSRGVATITTLVSGTATAEMKNINGEDGPGIEAASETGSPLTCDKVKAGMLTGGAQAGAFTALDQPTTEDEVVTNVFVSQ